jgi:hypothetical protein
VKTNIHTTFGVNEDAQLTVTQECDDIAIEPIVVSREKSLQLAAATLAIRCGVKADNTRIEVCRTDDATIVLRFTPAGAP